MALCSWGVVHGELFIKDCLLRAMIYLGYPKNRLLVSVSRNNPSRAVRLKEGGNPVIKPIGYKGNTTLARQGPCQRH